MNIPRLYLLVGLPGSGKSSFAKIRKDSGVIISSDEIREELFGDARIQDNSGQVFELMRKRAHDALEKGSDVYWDATNMTRKARLSAISCKTPETKVNAYVIWNTLDRCIELDSLRDRTVGKDVIMRMAKNFQFPFYDEGIQNIQIFLSEDAIGSNADEINPLEGTKINQDNPHHTRTIYDHCLAAYDYALNKEMDQQVRTAAKYHDCGKPEVKNFIDSRGNFSEVAHYYGHQGVSAWKATGWIDDPETLWLISSHMEPFFDSKYYNNMSPWMRNLIDQLHEADMAAH